MGAITTWRDLPCSTVFTGHTNTCLGTLTAGRKLTGCVCIIVLSSSTQHCYANALVCFIVERFHRPRNRSAMVGSLLSMTDQFSWHPTTPAMVDSSAAALSVLPPPLPLACVQLGCGHGFPGIAALRQGTIACWLGKTLRGNYLVYVCVCFYVIPLLFLFFVFYFLLQNSLEYTPSVK